MKFNRLFYPVAILTACAPSLNAMENPLIGQVEVVDYEESRDLSAIEAIFAVTGINLP